ncbi:MAG: hypothetical protein ACLQGJ_02815 [Candidatus Dormibacteria bacterium]
MRWFDSGRGYLLRPRSHLCLGALAAAGIAEALDYTPTPPVHPG